MLRTDIEDRNAKQPRSSLHTVYITQQDACLNTTCTQRWGMTIAVSFVAAEVCSK